MAVVAVLAHVAVALPLAYGIAMSRGRDGNEQDRHCRDGEQQAHLGPPGWIARNLQTSVRGQAQQTWSLEFQSGVAPRCSTVCHEAPILHNLARTVSRKCCP